MGLLGHSEGGTAGHPGGGAAPGAGVSGAAGRARPARQRVDCESGADPGSPPDHRYGAGRRRHPDAAPASLPWCSKRPTAPWPGRASWPYSTQPAPRPPAVARQLRRQIAIVTSPGYRALLADNPAQTLRSVKCPVLALNGTKDMQVDASYQPSRHRQSPESQRQP